MEVGSYLLRITELLPATEGKEAGQCVACGFRSDKGNKIDFSDNFLGWNQFQSGSILCEYCYTLCRSSQDYRRRSWVLSRDGIRFIRREEIIGCILEPPEPPFAIYLTETGQKQGFLSLISRPNFSRTRYILAFDDKLVNVEAGQARKFHDIISKARDMKFTKTELMSSPSAHRWKDREICEQIMQFSKNPLWQVIVYASK
jgi:CRISPR type IV-associated protein Csf1